MRTDQSSNRRELTLEYMKRSHENIELDINSRARRSLRGQNNLVTQYFPSTRLEEERRERGEVGETWRGVGMSDQLVVLFSTEVEMRRIHGGVLLVTEREVVRRLKMESE